MESKTTYKSKYLWNIYRSTNVGFIHSGCSWKYHSSVNFCFPSPIQELSQVIVGIWSGPIVQDEGSSTSTFSHFRATLEILQIEGGKFVGNYSVVDLGSAKLIGHLIQGGIEWDTTTRVSGNRLAVRRLFSNRCSANMTYHCRRYLVTIPPTTIQPMKAYLVFTSGARGKILARALSTSLNKWSNKH